MEEIPIRECCITPINTAHVPACVIGLRAETLGGSFSDIDIFLTDRFSPAKLDIPQLARDVGARPTKDEVFLVMAQLISSRSTCRRRHVGCILTDARGEQIAMGYNGTAAGSSRDCYCADAGRLSCVHAEANAVAKRAWRGDTKAYVTISPCVQCAALLVNAEVRSIVVGQVYRSEEGLGILREAGCEVTIVNPEPAVPKPD